MYIYTVHINGAGHAPTNNREVIQMTITANGKTYEVTASGIKTSTHTITCTVVSREPNDYNVNQIKSAGQDPACFRVYGPANVRVNGKINDNILCLPCEVAVEYDKHINAANEAKRAEEASTAAATVTFLTSGWEAHQVSVDTRKDLDAQFASIAANYPHDCTAESVKADYEKTVAEAIAKAEAKRAVEIANCERHIAAAEKGTVYATVTEAKAAWKRYNDTHNEGGEGYVPHFYTQAEVDGYKKRLAALSA